jgi:subtilisin family serine protease
MKAYSADEPKTQSKTEQGPSDELRIAVTFRPRATEFPGPTKFGARLSTASIGSFAPEPTAVDLALGELARRGFEVTARGRLTASVRGKRQEFEKVFGTRLDEVRLRSNQFRQFNSFYFPSADAPWSPEPGIQSILDDAYIQWPHVYMAGRPRGTRSKTTRASATRPKAARKGRGQIPAAALAGVAGPSALPPNVPYHHLMIPTDVARHLNATPAHRQGITGRGVRVAMIDSGFEHSHPFFSANSYASSVVLAPKATNRDKDANGHGTGESANVFAVAPGVTFIGIKVDNDADPRAGASILEGFQEALTHQPHVISISLGYDLRVMATNRPLAPLPNNLVALEAEIQAAIAGGTVVVFSAGNGHYAFPGQMPEVISAGGVYLDEAGALQASDYASAFPSAIYSGRTVPDFCGLVGLLPHADYITLPVPPGCIIDQNNSVHDGTAPNDGWGVFSGTSAAAPQIAGVCALLLEANPRLSPAEIKGVLRRTARDVVAGHANPFSDPSGAGGIRAAPNEDGATGAGLVDANAAVLQVR